MRRRRENIYDSENINDKYEEGKFQKVPIGESQASSIEVYNVYSGIDGSKAKCRRKIYNVILVIMVIAIFFMLAKILKLTNLINEDPEPVLNNDNIREDFDEENDEYRDNEVEVNEIFYILQKKDKIDLKNFSSPQLRKPENIKIIEKLEVSLDLEYQKYIHLTIKDPNNKRWELPQKEVLEKEYILNRNDNKIPITKNSNDYDSQNDENFFYVQFLYNKTNVGNENENEKDNINDDNDPDNVDNPDIDKEVEDSEEIIENFGFRLVSQEDEEFYKFTTTKNFLFSDTYIHFESQLTSDNIYGFGERTHDFKLNEGIYTIWPHDCGGTKYDDGRGGMNQYSHQPIGLHKTKYQNIWLGFVFMNTNAQDVEISSDKNNTYLTHKTIGGIIDYYIIVEDSPEEVVKSIQNLLGIPPLPPFWSLGYHQSRYGYKSFNEFRDVYEKYKKLEIPIDGMWIDIDSLDNFEMFTLNSKFKGVSNYVANNIHKDGGKFIPIVDIGFSYENKDNEYIKLGEELDIFIKSNYTKKNLIGKVWPGKTVFPDFFHPNISVFWNQGLRDYYKLVNYDGIWLDMNEPANLLENSNSKCIGEIVDEKECTPEKNEYYNDELPYIPGFRKNIKENLSQKSISENALVYPNNTIYDSKPFISYYQTKYTYHFLNSHLEKRPFILSRSTSIGSGKYTFHWLGDNLSTFGNLKDSISGIFNFNIFGIPLTGSDICGFMENADNDLCVRWYNLGVFYPFSRNHNFFASKDQYPWSFNSDSINIIKKNINLRYSLIRYIYSEFFLISLNEKGSFFKPLMFEFPEDEASYENIESKIMFGEAFLLCTFYENNQNSKKFKFPNSNFNSFHTGKSIVDETNEGDKNKIVELSGSLDKIHLFLRGGFIVPYQDVFDKYILNTAKLRNEKINLIVNLDNYNQSKGDIFFDNDDVDVIKNDTFYRVEISFLEQKLTFNTYKNRLDNYNYNDHILGKIEFWRISQVLEIRDKNDNKSKIINLNITYTDMLYPSESLEGIYDQENDKAIFEISKGDKNVSIFDIMEMEIFNLNNSN